MLKKISLKKIAITSAALFATILIYLIPSNKQILNIDSDLKYTSDKTHYSAIFLLDKNNYVALTTVAVTSNNIEEKAKQLLNILISGGEEEKIPSGFKSIIPPDTQIKSLKYQNGLIKVDFSKELLEINENQEEKMIEAIIYTLTSIKEVNKIIIYVDGQILSKLPKTKINLPSTLDRSFGINKEYEFTSLENIIDVTVYYVNKNKENYYYIPVTKYLNDNRDKISIIIQELTNNFGSSSKLMSFADSNLKLVSTTQQEDTLKLNFNSYIFDDVTTKEVLEEVVYTICLSVYDNYDVDKVVLMSNNKEIYKTMSKNLEINHDL